DIRDVEALHAALGLLRRRFFGCGGGRLGLLLGRFFGLGGLGRLLGSGVGAFDLQLDQLVTLFQGVTDIDLDGCDGACLGAGHLDAGLVLFQRDQTLLGLDAVTDLHQDLDDFAFTADVGYLEQFAHGSSPQQSSGLGLFGFSPKVVWASTSTSGCSSPFSTSATSVV